jgi:hypothetical protein
MSLVDRTPESVFLRFSLGFPAVGADLGPVVIWAEIDLGAPGRKFRLEPLRFRADGEVAEWYLAENRPLTMQIFWRYATGSIRVSNNLTIPSGIHLTLGEIARRPDQTQDGFD